jgi:hypothetical protein
MAVGAETFQQMKLDISRLLLAQFEDVILQAEDFVKTSLDIENMVGTKMESMTALEFEGLLRPVFKQEEWILIITGAVLGFLVGEAQLQIMTHL